jgi:hypothetical protein
VKVLTFVDELRVYFNGFIVPFAASLFVAFTFRSPIVAKAAICCPDDKVCPLQVLPSGVEIMDCYINCCVL